VTIEKTTATSLEKTACKRSPSERVDPDRFKKVKPNERPGPRKDPAARK